MHVASLAETQFLRLAERLGRIIGHVDVRVEDSSRSLISSVAAIPFHTDGPEAELVGWWCAEPDASNGANSLIDTFDMASHLDRADLEELTRTQIYRPIAGGTVEPHPCVFLRDGRYRIYYAPWNLLPSYGAAQHHALYALREYLRSQRPFVVMLRRGESLFIDNERVLHGRAALPADSRRHLRRVWIRRRAMQAIG